MKLTSEEQDILYQASSALSHLYEKEPSLSSQEAARAYVKAIQRILLDKQINPLDASSNL